MAGMFKPTPSLNSRVEARLRGWRGPAVQILRREVKRTDPYALNPPFADLPACETSRALPVERAHEMMGLPMQDILDMRGGTRRPVERDDLLHWERARGLEHGELKEVECGIAKASQKTRPQGPYRLRLGAAEVGAVPKVNPARYKPPATNYWRHSIYAYNKQTIKNLPATTMNANRMVRAYFNMIPKEEYAQELLSGATPGDQAAVAAANANPEGSQPTSADSTATPAKPSEGKPSPSDMASMSPEDKAKAVAAARGEFERANRVKLREHKTTETRVYISDRGYTNKGMIRQDVLGKISQRMQPKTTFHYPYRAMQDAAAQITYKHWRGGVGVSVYVHEGQPEVKALRKRQ